MVWLSSAISIGKSAVGQTFALECDKQGQLEATFFFSQTNKQNKYKMVIPTLAYQLSTHCPLYHLALISKVDHDHQIFHKTPPVQLRKLIVELFLEIQSQIMTTFLMLLDGVDECRENLQDLHEHEKEQCELVKMIAKTVHNHLDLPLF
jgi:hypothetical protein